MEIFDWTRCESIKKRIEDATARWGAQVWVHPSNYDFSANILVRRPDGAKSAWVAGLINAPLRPDEVDNWKPETCEVEPAILEAINFAKPI